jgi:hypothetical protein
MAQNPQMIDATGSACRNHFRVLVNPSSSKRANVRYWPKADMGYCAAHVRFRG